jgi:chromosome segregation ATPase
VEVLEWRKKHEVMKRLNYSLLEKMALKVIKQLDDVEEESKAKVSEERNRYDEMGRLYDELLEKVGEMADENGKLVLKCVQLSQETTKQAKLEADLKQMQSDNEAVKSQVDGWKEKHQTMVQINEEIVGKMCQLSEENDELRFKCQEIEFGKAESEATTAVQRMTSMRAIIADEGPTEDVAEQTTSTGQDTLNEIKKLRVENNTLHQSMESALELASAMNDKMTSFVVAHNISVQGYEEKIASMKSELKKTTSSEEESSIGSKILREQVETLHENLRQYESVVLDLEAERNDAYDTCKILQQEIDFLSQRFASNEYQAEFTEPDLGLNHGMSVAITPMSPIPE